MTAALVLPTHGGWIGPGVQHFYVVSLYLKIGLSAELEQDFLALIARGKRHRVAHLELVASWYIRHNQRRRAIAVYLQLRKLNPPESDRYDWWIKRAEAAETKR